MYRFELYRDKTLLEKALSVPVMNVVTLGKMATLMASSKVPFPKKKPPSFLNPKVEEVSSSTSSATSSRTDEKEPCPKISDSGDNIIHFASRVFKGPECLTKPKNPDLKNSGVVFGAGWH